MTSLLIAVYQVCTPDGTYVPAKPIPGTIVVNIGDSMQMMTTNKLLSNVRHYEYIGSYS